MARVVLLVAGIDIGAKTRNVRTGSLEVIEGLKIRVVGKVVVETKILPVVDVMVEAECNLILTVRADWDPLVAAIGTVCSGHEAKQIHRYGIRTRGWNGVPWEHRGPVKLTRARRSQQAVNTIGRQTQRGIATGATVQSLGHGGVRDTPRKC